MSARRSQSGLLFLTGLLLVAFNLRAALSGIGPLVEFIRADFGLSGVQLGLLTTLPLLAFSFVSVFTPVLTNRFGVGETVLGAMLILAVGILLRSVLSVFGLYAGTILLGVAIAFGNVIIPTITKQHYSENAGIITGVYSCMMSLGAAVAAGVAVPVAVSAGFGWRGSLAVWAIPAVLAFLVWRTQLGRVRGRPAGERFLGSLRRLSRIPLVWQIAGFMGLQSMGFYVVLAWLPAILIEAGQSETFSGWMLSLSQATGVVGSVVVPVWAGRRKDQRLVIAVLVVLEFVSLAGLMFPAGDLLLGVWVAVVGFVHGGTFGLALLLIVLRSSTAETATRLSGIVQSIGYLVASVGPLITGMIYDVTLSWNYALGFLLLVVFLKLLTGLEAGKRRTI